MKYNERTTPNGNDRYKKTGNGNYLCWTYWIFHGNLKNDCTQTVKKAKPIVEFIYDVLKKVAKSGKCGDVVLDF